MPSIDIETGVRSAMGKGITYTSVKVPGYPTVLLRHMPTTPDGPNLWLYIHWTGTPKASESQHTAVCEALGLRKDQLPEWTG